MACAEARSLRSFIAETAAERFFFDAAGRIRLADLRHSTSLGGRLAALADKSILIATGGQLSAALALIELDGVARRLTILPPDADPDHFATLAARAEADAVVLDAASPHSAAFAGLAWVVCSPALMPADPPLAARTTEWLLLTSGTTGVPKVVAHSLATLTAPMAAVMRAGDAVWGTFYDIRRYGGLQIFLRAVLGGTSLILSHAGEPVADHLQRLGRHGVTHLSGTPSHWRRALMSPALGAIAPRYVRLSGEIADQVILDALRAAFAHASVGHAYASTEAGVAFEVDDGLAGFPASFLDEVRNGVAMKIVDGTLRIRSPRAALRYIGQDVPALADADGYIDSGDVIERQGARCYFAGRRGGIINIGGLKVHPEEVEAVINRHPQVRMSLVRPKRNPVTGAIVTADVVLKSSCAGEASDAVKSDILALCRATLPRHKVPASISIVPALDVAATGKLARRHG